MEKEVEKYQLEINQTESIELTDRQLLQTDIIEIAENTYHLIINGKSLLYEVQSIDLNAKKVFVKSNGKVYYIEIKDELDQLIESMGMEIKESGVDTHILAPMPGLVLEIAVTEGAEVKKGDILLILEAMKMENVIKSPGDAIVSKILISPKDSVEKGAVLIEFE